MKKIFSNKIFSNKKLILILLIIILTIVLLSNYIKTAEISLFELFNKDEALAESLFFKEEQNKSAAVKKAKNDAETNKAETKEVAIKNVNKEAKIESIALISEIKDPFNQKENTENIIQDNKSFNKNTKQDLLFLEKNIIAENLKSLDKGSAQVLKQNQKAGADKDHELKETNNKLKQNIKLPFKLLGIIKNKDNSAALFRYQGKNVLKKENEQIDIYKIKEINNKEISLIYQNEIRIIKLWEEGANEG
ncbi:hypothetical protein HSACCH_01260 [Halanaerobium saccharolyticum subsp. saccharolyticum DSM 6643]|uniref:Uncharacterized protein n=1 Tax=Halanaerobium saccharolyticum subsp. saccharolyticum DSM 6643 TaxID=1293054 RepID=M5EE43_9FIRM|nr:hypothetical protein [Halanaerobium saccharolyticum]CCU79351.1 hypothetical protein HSACCH_01260 [Halanaerobium saccharolyticum subsp. saccharolyticum DSM 6643]